VRRVTEAVLVPESERASLCFPDSLFAFLQNLILGVCVSVEFLLLLISSHCSRAPRQIRVSAAPVSVGPARRAAIMPEMDTASRASESKRSRKTARPVRRAVNEEMKVSDAKHDNPAELSDRSVCVCVCVCVCYGELVQIQTLDGNTRFTGFSNWRPETSSSCTGARVLQGFEMM